MLRRLASMGYESLVVAAILVVGGFAFFGVAAALRGLGEPPAIPTGPIERTLLQAVLLALLGAYFTRSWARGGQTLAMKAWRLRVVRPDGRGIESWRALARFVLAGLPLASGVAAAIWLWRHPQSILGWLAAAPAAADIAWALADREGQFLHDRLAGTRVVLIGNADR
jgi:uncharacterized RDD family membrane protein YckC